MQEDDFDEEPADIGGDSKDEIATNPARCQPPSSVGTHEQPAHYFTLDLGAISQLMDSAPTFGGRGLHEKNSVTEFQVGQSFHSKEEVVLTVKDYSIRRGVEYRVMESDHFKYHGRCNEFGKGCTWMIRISLRARKGTWEVRRYNGPHTCLATSISSDHRQLDYHVICAKIFSLVRANAAVSIKVLQEATEGTYGFKPSYRKMWLVKQKAVAQIYGDWEESYAELPRWILDRYNGIKAALENPNSGWLPPLAYQAFCIRHVATNFALSFKGTDAKRLLVNTAYAKTEEDFHYWFDIMRTENPAMCDWANRIEYDKWTQHQDGGRRFGPMTTNISECVNSILKGTQNLPVTALVKSTDGRLAELFVICGQTAEAQLASGAKFCKHQSEYTVAETTPTRGFSLGTYRVSLQHCTCDCGYFQALHYPCCHAIACCAQSRLDWSIYVDEVYTMQKVFRVYQMGFVTPIPEGLWPPYDGPTVIPDPSLRHCHDGRSRSTRIRNNMDEADPNRPKRCGLCR
ncbi:uncharacterized protein [Arachis hypogaea]|uniref:uncharacterized protein n=1 Tax=Arachis hypogaea TaxID=3818 RepID=UPI003B21B6F8